MLLCAQTGAGGRAHAQHDCCVRRLAREDARMLLRLNMTAEPYEVSALWTLWYIKSAGGMGRMNAFKGGAQVTQGLVNSC